MVLATPHMLPPTPCIGFYGYKSSKFCGLGSGTELNVTQYSMSNPTVPCSRPYKSYIQKDVGSLPLRVTSKNTAVPPQTLKTLTVCIHNPKY